MVKTPEEYVAEQSFDLPQTSADRHLSVSEKAFVEKYLGNATNIPSVNPDEAQAMQDGGSGNPGQISWNILKNKLRNEPSIQMFSFYIRKQIFLLPIIIIKEVLRYIPIVRLPKAPDFMAGVINLRGRVTPLLHLDALLTLEKKYRYSEQSFIIICSTDQMQLGLIIDKVHTMHSVEQNKITWNAEAQLGESADFLCGVADLQDRICGILAPDLIIQKLLS